MTKTQSARAGMAALTFFISLGLTACQPVPSNNAPVANTNATAANVANIANANATTASSPAIVPASSAVAAGQPVTLAVLDALFADESFARDLKSRLGLTDEQIASLRKAGQDERASLREAKAGDGQGTTRDATSRANAKIKAVVGEEKVNQLFALARERWSGNGGGESGAATTATAERPNAVPSDTRVVVNAPAYRMDIFEQGRLVKSYKIGIGYPEFPLPAGMRKAETIIFNPEWTPPDEPWVEAPGSRVKVGEKVPAGSKLNPLGPVKIPIGLPSLIHGGKSPARLGGFASHGCVGLTNEGVLNVTHEIARLGGTNLTEEDFQKFAQDKTKPKGVKLAHAVPVELRYETIVVTDDGKLHIYRDVYDRGTNTEENLRRVLEAHGFSFEELDSQQRAHILDALRQMARDATGKPAEGDGTERPDTNADPVKSAASKNAVQNANGARVTRTIKGQKEIVIDLPALRGKGYPVPVGGGFDTSEEKGKAGQSKRGKRR